MDDGFDVPPKKNALLIRLIGGFIVAGAIAFCVYILIDASIINSGALASIWFLGFLPAFLCAGIAFVAAPYGDEKYRNIIPLILVALVVFVSGFFLKEGVVCIIMLAPIWILFGYIGIWVYSKIIRQVSNGANNKNNLNSSFIILPLLLGYIETQIDFPHESISLRREIVINATAAEIWPYAVSNKYISPKEGKWNFSQSVLGIPRPRATSVDYNGIGATRTAYWGDNIHFDEIITKWEQDKYLGWDFRFTNDSVSDYIDHHISPDGEYLKIDKGFYQLVAINGKQTKLILQTDYIAKTHVNFYSRIWGEIMLGDIQNNVLKVIKDRAEGRVKTNL